MSTLTIRLTDEQHERLRALAAHRGVSLNKLFEEFSIKALAEFDVESRFRARAARGEERSAKRTKRIAFRASEERRPKGGKRGMRFQ